MATNDKSIDFSDNGNAEFGEDSNGNAYIEHKSSGERVYIDQDSFNLEALSVNKPNDDEMLVLDSITEADDIYDVDEQIRNTDPKVPVTDGVRFNAGSGAPKARNNQGYCRLYLSEHTPLARIHNGTATELLKVFGNGVALENDLTDGGISLQSRRGGNISIRTSTGKIGQVSGNSDKVDRFRVPDNEQEKNTPEFVNTNGVQLNGHVKMRQNASGDNSYGLIRPEQDQGLFFIETKAPTMLFRTGGKNNFRCYDNGTTRFDDRVSFNGNATSNCVWNSGATSARPSNPSEGQRYYDNDLGQPIWYNGTNWTDAMGSQV